MKNILISAISLDTLCYSYFQGSLHLWAQAGEKKNTGLFVPDKSFFLEMFAIIHQSLDFLVVVLNNQNNSHGLGLGYSDFLAALVSKCDDTVA